MLTELGTYIWKRKKWWLLPPIVMLVLTGVLIYVTSVAPVSPFIYMLF